MSGVVGRRYHKFAPSVRPSAILKGDFERNRDFAPATLLQAADEQIDLAHYISFIGPVNIVIRIG